MNNILHIWFKISLSAKFEIFIFPPSKALFTPPNHLYSDGCEILELLDPFTDIDSLLDSVSTEQHDHRL